MFSSDEKWKEHRKKLEVFSVLRSQELRLLSKIFCEVFSVIHKKGCYNNSKCGLQQKIMWQLSRMFSFSGDIINSESDWHCGE